MLPLDVQAKGLSRGTYFWPCFTAPKFLGPDFARLMLDRNRFFNNFKTNPSWFDDEIDLYLYEECTLVVLWEHSTLI